MSFWKIVFPGHATLVEESTKENGRWAGDKRTPNTKLLCLLSYSTYMTSTNRRVVSLALIRCKREYKTRLWADTIGIHAEQLKTVGSVC